MSWAPATRRAALHAISADAARQMGFSRQSIAEADAGPLELVGPVEALEDAARGLGFGDAEARRLALATFSGAVRLAEQSDSEPLLLRAQVTSCPAC